MDKSSKAKMAIIIFFLSFLVLIILLAIFVSAPIQKVSFSTIEIGLVNFTQKSLFFEAHSPNEYKEIGIDSSTGDFIVKRNNTEKYRIITAIGAEQGGNWYLSPLRNPISPVLETRNMYIGWNDTGTNYNLYRFSDWENIGTIGVRVDEMGLSCDEESICNLKLDAQTAANYSDRGGLYFFKPMESDMTFTILGRAEIFNFTEARKINISGAQKYMDLYDKSGILYTFDFNDLSNTIFAEIVNISGIGMGLILGTYGYGSGNRWLIDPITTLYERDTIYALCNYPNNQNRELCYYISKNQGTILSNFDPDKTNETYAHVEFELEKSGNVYNFTDYNKTWVNVSGADYIELNGTAVVDGYTFRAKFYLGDYDEMLNVELLTDVPSPTLVVSHYNITIGFDKENDYATNQTPLDETNPYKILLNASDNQTFTYNDYYIFDIYGGDIHFNTSHTDSWTEIFYNPLYYNRPIRTKRNASMFNFYWVDAISQDSFLINTSSIGIAENTTINAVFTTTANWDGSVFVETTADARITDICNSNQIKLMNCTTRGGQGECECQANFTVFCTVADEVTNVTWIAEGCSAGTAEYRIGWEGDSSADGAHSGNLTVTALDYSVNLTINGLLNQNVAVTYPTKSNVNGTCGDNAGTCFLHRNNTVVSTDSSTPFLVGENITLAAGYNYNYTINNTNNATGISYILDVSRAAGNSTLNIFPSSTLTYGTQIQANCTSTDLDSGGKAILYRNGTDVTAAENGTFVTLAAGDHKYNCTNAANNGNYTFKNTSYVYTVSKAGTQVNLTLNGIEANLTLTYPQPVNATFWNGNGTVNAYRNGTNINSENVTNVTVGASYWNYTAEILDNENYTGSRKTFFATVNKGAGNISMYTNVTTSQQTIFQANIYCNGTGTGNVTLYNNSIKYISNITKINITETFANAQNNNWTCKMDDIINYTQAEEMVWINATAPPLFYCNGALNNSANAWFKISSNVVCSNESITLGSDSDIEIMNGGNLTIKEGTNLTFVMTADGGSSIKKNQTAGLWIYNSKINSSNSEYEYDFWAYGVGSNDNFTMQNSIIQDAGYSSGSQGIQLYNVSNVKVTGNNVNDGTLRGLYLQYSTNNNLSSNTITTNGTNGYGIQLYAYSNSNTLQSNNITTNGTNGYGIYLSILSKSNTLQSNTITTSNTSAYGIYLLDSSNSNNVSSNTITTSGSSAYGIYLRTNSNSNTLQSNNITTNGTNGYGIYLSSSSNSNTLQSNNITTSGTFGYGIYLFILSNSNTLTSNTISTNGSSAYGIYLSSSSNNNATSNIINVSDNYGVYIISSSTGNNFINNELNKTYGIGSDNNFINCSTRNKVNITATGTYSKLDVINCDTVFVEIGNTFLNNLNFTGNNYGINVTTATINATNVSFNGIVTATNGVKLSLINSSFTSITALDTAQVYVYYPVIFNVTNTSRVNPLERANLTIRNLNGTTNITTSTEIITNYSNFQQYFNDSNSTGNALYSVGVFDLDQDGKRNDVVFGGYGNISAFYNNGSLAWEYSFNGSNVYDIEVFDRGTGFNNTIAITNFEALVVPSLIILDKNGNKLCNTSNLVDSVAIAIGDFNEDGNKSEIVVINRQVGDIYVFYPNCTQMWTSDVSFFNAREVETGDLDNDGYYDDIVMVGSANLPQGDDLEVFNGSGANIWGISGIGISSAEIKDFDGKAGDDIIIDIGSGIRAYNGSGYNLWNFTGTTGNIWEIRFGNFSNNGIVAFVDDGLDYLFVLNASGKQSWNASLNMSYGYSLAVGDLDNDNKDDIVLCANASTGCDKIMMFSNSGSNLWNYTLGDDIGSTFADGALEIADIDGDGKNDVIAASNDNYGYVLKAQNGTITITTSYSTVCSGLTGTGGINNSCNLILLDKIVNATGNHTVHYNATANLTGYTQASVPLWNGINGSRTIYLMMESMSGGAPVAVITKAEEWWGRIIMEGEGMQETNQLITQTKGNNRILSTIKRFINTIINIIRGWF